MPEGFDEAKFRQVVLENFDLSLGAGVGKVKGKVFRIGHLGDFNDLMLCATLCGVEIGLEQFDVPFLKGRVMAALDYLSRGDRCPSNSQPTRSSSEDVAATYRWTSEHRLRNKRPML